MGLLLRSPLHGPIGKRLLLLEYTGRKSGKGFRLPVAYVREGWELLLADPERLEGETSGAGCRCASGWRGSAARRSPS